MSFTFSNNQEVDYPALGMCDVCGKRFTQGCEHSNTMEAQKWLAAYVAVETSLDNVEYFMKIAEETRPHVVDEAEFEDGFCDERLTLKMHSLTIDFSGAVENASRRSAELKAKIDARRQAAKERNKGQFTPR